MHCKVVIQRVGHSLCVNHLSLRYGYSDFHPGACCEGFMGWLWLVGSKKIHVSFAECSLFNRALLQKRLIIFSILLTEATPKSFNHFDENLFTEVASLDMFDITRFECSISCPIRNSSVFCKIMSFALLYRSLLKN